MFQDYALFPELTALENIMFPLMMQGNSRIESEHRARSVLHDLSLSEQADKLPNRMSGGQQQRVSIARAIARSEERVIAVDTSDAARVQSAVRRSGGSRSRVVVRVLRGDPRRKGRGRHLHTP